LLWPHPSVYFPFGLLRRRGNVFAKDIQLYIGGYPRSGNTFTRAAFLSANPRTNIQSHRHIPTFVIHQLNSGMPGLVLIRKPLDAAVSWAIHEDETLEEALAYWSDYYETLLPMRSQLFVARFEDVTTNLGNVMTSFNSRFGTSYVPFEHTPENAAICFQLIEDDNRKPCGEIREMRVCRPSAPRRMVKEAHLRELTQSDFLRKELVRAEEIYEAFVHDQGDSQRRAPVRLLCEKPDTSMLRVGAPV
jgi:hypothetical protein